MSNYFPISFSYAIHSELEALLIEFFFTIILMISWSFILFCFVHEILCNLAGQPQSGGGDTSVLNATAVQAYK